MWMKIKTSNIIVLVFSMNVLLSFSSVSDVETSGNNYIDEPRLETLPRDLLETYVRHIELLKPAQEAPAELRFQIMLSVLERRSRNPETAPSAVIRRLADHDLKFMQNTL